MKTLFVSGFVILLAISAWATLNNDSDMTQSQNMGNEGIKVHGDWEVKIIDPDGSSEVFAFKNALTAGGGQLLTKMLLGQAHIVEWSIMPVVGNLPLMCSNGTSFTANMGLYLPTDIAPISLNAIGGPSDTFKGHGIYLAATCIIDTEILTNSPNAKLNGVQTKVKFSDINPNETWKLGGTLPFTAKALNPGIEIENGQIVQFTVKISVD